MASEAARRFLDSMNIGFDQWHDGTGYDLEALRQCTPEELVSIETTLVGRASEDWRDLEALAALDTPRARKAILGALKSSRAEVRAAAARYAGPELDDRQRERELVKLLESAAVFEGLTATLDQVEEFHPPAVVKALLKGTLKRDGTTAVHYAAMLFFIHGKAESAFDWDHRPFFLRFNTQDGEERKAAFRELCDVIGVDPRPYL